MVREAKSGTEISGEELEIAEALASTRIGDNHVCYCRIRGRVVVFLAPTKLYAYWEANDCNHSVNYRECVTLEQAIGKYLELLR